MESSSGGEPGPSTPRHARAARFEDRGPSIPSRGTAAFEDDSGLIRLSVANPTLDGQPHSAKKSSRPRSRLKLLYEKRVTLFAILAALPGIGFGTTLIWTSTWSQDAKISLTVLELLLWLVLTLALLDQIVHPLQTLTNVVGALREEDYSFRARGAAPNDAMGELALEINALADILTEQRLQTIEATALLRRPYRAAWRHPEVG